MDNTARTLLGKINQAFYEFHLPENREPENTAGVFLFFSVDLINSTLFKTVNPYTWVSVFKDFYDIIGAQVKEAYINAEIWKYVGDEVLFYIEAKNIEQVLAAPSLLYSAMARAQDIFHREHSHAECVLYMKSALWLAAVSDSKNLDYMNTAPNICTNLSAGLDFIGVDIDEGFRMSANAARGKLVLDPKILYILNKYTEEGRDLSEYNIAGNIRNVGFAFLKGVWEGRAYPVIWYCDRWDDVNLFLYDEHYTNPFVKEYLSRTDHIKDLSYIKKIVKDLGFIESKIGQIETLLEDDRIAVAEPAGTEGAAGLHYETVCFDPVHNKLLIVKKSAGEKTEPRRFIYLQK